MDDKDKKVWIELYKEYEARVSAIRKLTISLIDEHNAVLEKEKNVPMVSDKSFSLGREREGLKLRVEQYRMERKSMEEFVTSIKECMEKLGWLEEKTK